MTWGQELQLEHERAFKEGLEQGIEKGIEQGIEKGIEQGIEKGIEQGIQKKTIDSAKKLLQQNIPDEIIIKCIEISKAQLETLKMESGGNSL